VPKNLTFEAFYYPLTYHLKLVVSGPSLYPKAIRDHHVIDPFVLMIPSQDFPQYPQVGRSKASDIQIVTVISDEYDYMSEIPRQAVASDGTVKFFKPALDKSQVIMEIEMHSRIVNVGLKGKIRVAGLHSIVVSKDATMTIGLLFDLIPSVEESLNSPICRMASEHHAKWKRQVTDIVNELHSHDIVWGDVHPGNIVIDESSDAWVVDFGGGWFEDFVDRKRAGTKRRLARGSENL
jgi:serine/threonine protein kinase